MKSNTRKRAAEMTLLRQVFFFLVAPTHICYMGYGDASLKR